MTLHLTEAQFQAMQGNAPGTPTRSGIHYEREEQLSFDMHLQLEAWELEGRFKGVYFHIPNEIKPPKMKAYQAKRFWEKRKNMGIRPGAPDWVICWNTGMGFIELKAPATYKVSEKTGKQVIDKPSGGLSDNQIAFQQECQQKGVKYAVCFSVAEVEACLEEWGAFGDFEHISLPLGNVLKEVARQVKEGEGNGNHSGGN